MILKTYITGMIENNNYLLIDEKSKEAILIDCSEYLEEIKDTLKKYDAKLKYVLITHGHFDHVLGLSEFHKNMPEVEILAPKGDRDLIEGIDDFMKKFVGSISKVEVPPVTKYIDENDKIFIGEEQIKVIETSGHTKGGVCYFVDEKLFSGDTIFLESVGRTDLPGGSYEQIRKSVQKVLNMFDDNMKIYAGHGDTTTVGYEKENNPAL